jgi:hypothetical protein
LTSGARLLRHPWPCVAIPAAVPSSRTQQHHPRRCGSPRRQDITTPTAVHPPAFRQLHPRVSVRTATKPGSTYTTTLEAAPRWIQDSARCPTGARFVRRTINFTALCGTIVNCLPLAYKRRRRSPGRGGDDRERLTCMFPPSPQYWHFASIKPQGPGGFPSSPALLVAPLYKHNGATQYSTPSTPLLDVRPVAGTMINPYHCVI